MLYSTMQGSTPTTLHSSATMDTVRAVLSVAEPNHAQCAQVVQAIKDELVKGAFPAALKTLQEAINQTDLRISLECLLRCLLWSATNNDSSTAAVHVLLEALPSNTQTLAVDGGRLRALATELMLLYCSNSSNSSNSGSPRLAAKVATSCALTREDLGPQGWQQLSDALLIMLQQPSTYKPAVHLMMQFEGLDDTVDRVEVLTQLVADGQDVLAQQWATSLGKDYQVAFVEACVALDKLKPAARAVRQLQLSAEFPNIEALYRQRSLARLMQKRLWSVALSYAGSDVSLQTALVQGMAAAGELVLAEEFRQQLSLPQSTLAPPDPEALAAQEAARRDTYLQLELPPEAVMWVDDAAGCSRAAQALSGSDVLGLDVEWKPSHISGITSPAAVLQVATRTNVVLFDLMSLCQQQPEALNACLGPLLTDASVLKLGVEVSGDLAKLAGSWPGLSCWQQVHSVLDLRPLWVAYGQAEHLQGGSARTLSAVGLSTLCSALLGKPLDKSQQMSDWTARPLSARQMQYAALDALVLPQLFDALTQRLGPTATLQLVAQNSKTFSRPSPGSPSSSPQQQLNPSEGDAPVRRSPSKPPAAPTAAVTHGNQGPASPSAAAAAPQQAAAGQARVLSLLQRHGLTGAYQQLHLVRTQASPHPTAWDTAAASGVPVHSVAKTMMLLVDTTPHLVVTRGDQRVDMHKLATLLGVKRRSIVLAPETTVEQLTGFKAGVPPVGLGSSVRVTIDRRLGAPAPTGTDTLPAAAGGNPPPLPSHCSNTTDGAAAEPAAAAADRPSDAAASAPSHPPVTSTPISTSRGIIGIAAAAAAVVAPAASSAEVKGDAAVPMQQHAVRSITETSSRAPEQQHSSDVRHSTSGSSSAPGTLVVQCGPQAVLRLSFEELLQLVGEEATIADVADAPADGAAVSTITGAAAGGQHGAAAQAGPPKFLLDSMLGRLCRWLRALGVDAEFVEAGQQGVAQPSSALIQQIQEAAVLQGRLFLTRDQSLAMRRDVGGSVFLLHSNDAAEQLQQLRTHFGIKLEESNLMSRCGACNAAEYKRISHQEAAAHVTPHLLELVEEFWQCGRCGKVVWMGPKSFAAINLLEGLFAEGQTRPTPLRSSRK